MKKRFLSVVLALAMCLSMLPTMALAVEGSDNSPADITSTGLELELKTITPGGTTVYRAGEGTVTVNLTDDGSTLTLELNNATINTTGRYGINCDSFYSTDISKVIVTLIGASSITAAQLGLRFGQGQKDSGTLISVQGSGSLQIEAKNMGIRTCGSADLLGTIGGYTNLEFQSGTVTIANATDGFWADDSNVTMRGTAEVIFENCTDEGFFFWWISDDLPANTGLTVKDNSKLKITGSHYGIYAMQRAGLHLNVQDNAYIDIHDCSSYGICASQLNISGDAVVSAAVTGQNGLAVEARNITVTAPQEIVLPEEGKIDTDSDQFQTVYEADGTTAGKKVLFGVPVTSVSLDRDTLQMDVGDSVSLKACVLPQNASVKDVTWTTSDSSVATVDNNGNVTAIKEGTATITVTAGNDLTASCTVTVRLVKLYTVTVAASSAGYGTVTGGGTYDEGTSLTVTAAANEGYRFVNWTENGSSVSTSANYTFTVTSDKTLTAVFERLPATGIVLSPAELTVAEGRTGTLTVRVQPDGAELKPVIWISSNPTVASVDSSGKVTGVAAGTATITVTSGNFTAACIVTVNEIKDLEERPPELPSEGDNQYKLVMEDGLSTVPTELTSKYSSPEELQTALKAEITKIDISAANTAVYDVELMVSTNGGETWAKATAGNFPTNGKLTVTLPYPQGTNNSYTFRVVHMFTTSINSKNPGDVETPAVTNVEKGIQFTVTGLSPISVGWEKASSPSNPSGGSSSSGGGSSDSDSTYAVTVKKSEHGKVTSSRLNAESRDTVTLTVTPDSGYVLDTLTVTDSRGNELKLTAKGDGKYAFTMPGRAVTIKATFAPLPDNVEQPCDGGADCPSHDFTDLDTGTWYHEAVDYVLQNKLMGGYGNGIFGPNDKLSRAQLTQILYNQAGRPAVTSASPFTDVPDGAWYASAVTWAAAQGIVSGYGNGLFGPNDNITREQLAVMLWRCAGSPAAADKALHFTDADEAGDFSKEALRWAVESGIINGYGDGRLAPKEGAARAQAATMVQRYLENS